MVATNLKLEDEDEEEEEEVYRKKERGSYRRVDRLGWCRNCWRCHDNRRSRTEHSAARSDRNTNAPGVHCKGLPPSVTNKHLKYNNNNNNNINYNVRNLSIKTRNATRSDYPVS